MKSFQFVFFVVMVLALVFVTNAQITLTATNDCGSDCVIGATARLTITATTTLESLRHHAAGAQPTKFTLSIPLPYGSSMSSECVLLDGADGNVIIRSDFTANVGPLNGATSANAWSYASFDFNDTQLKKIARIVCPIIYPNMAQAKGLVPYNSLSFPARANEATAADAPNIPFTIPLPTGRTNFSSCTTDPKVDCGGGAWSAGAGLEGTLTLQLQIPGNLDANDLVQMDGTPLTSITSCTMAQSATQINGGSSFTATNGGGEDNDLGYLPIVCRGIIPGPSSTPTTVNVRFSRQYFPVPDDTSIVDTTLRFTTTAIVPPTQVSVIGSFSGAQNDALVSLYPLAAGTAGGAVSLQIQTSNFNSAFQFSQVPTGDDAGTVITSRGRIEVAFTIDDKFLAIVPTDEFTRQCTFTLNGRVPNYNANLLQITNQWTSNSGKTLNVQAQVNSPLAYTATVGQVVRIFCNGFTVKTGTGLSFPYNPTGSVALKIYGSAGSSVGQALSSGILFSTVTKETNAEPVDWVSHTLLIHTNRLLTPDQMNQVTSAYRSVLKLQANITVRISTQTLDSGLLRIGVAILGIATQPTTDIVRLLSAPAATSIANTIAQQWDISRLANQSPAAKITVPGHCNNQLKDEDETGVDCGGAGCLGCTAQNSVCASNSDCASGSCADSACASNNNAHKGSMMWAGLMVVIVAAIQVFF